MKGAELFRIRVAFSALGAVPVFLAGWLGYVQVGQAAALPRDGREALPLVAESADQQVWSERRIPAPRGRIVDCSGAMLASDCACYEVRARINVPRACRDDVSRLPDWIERLVDALSLAVVADSEQVGRLELRERVRQRVRRAIRRRWQVDGLPKSGAIGRLPAVDVLIQKGVDRLAVIDALHALDRSDAWPTLQLDFLHAFKRVYRERDVTYGYVGRVQSYLAQDEAGGAPFLFEGGVNGLEALRVLAPRAGARRRFLKDRFGRGYFVAPADGAPAPDIVHASLDLDLQRIAVDVLEAQAEKSDINLWGKRGKKALWGALTLIDLETGDVLAAAAWHRDSSLEKGAAFAPYQSRFEPGSIVKPLVLGYAREVGALDWSERFDCWQGGDDYRERIAGLGRGNKVSDDHDLKTPADAHEILVKSSNIGATYVGLMLTREQWQDYMDVYGFGRSLGLCLPHEAVGRPNRTSFDPGIPLRQFRANSAISFSFGYEMTATALQIARAYTRLFRGFDSELRVVRGVTVDGDYYELPATAGGERRFRSEVVEGVRRALVDVVSDQENATGRHVRQRFLKERNIELHGLVGGKTGTARSLVGVGGNRRELHKNASFVGFLPADEPRWLAVCVLQKDDSASFYGGSYAAPPAVELLLQCQKLHQRRGRRQETRSEPGGQTRRHRDGGDSDAVGLRSPGSTGWTDPVGAGSDRDTR